MRLSQFSLCVLSIAISSQLYAQDETSNNQTPVSNAQQQESVQKLPQIVITATRSEKSIADIAGTVQNISGAEVQKQAGAGRKVADVLAQLVPSLAPSSGTGSNYGQTMRGRTVLVMIDGVSQTGSRDPARQLNSISPGMIERIEVISGATSIYGSGATGGIINIITKRADKSKPLSFETKLGITSADNFRGDGLAYEAGQSVSFSNDKMDGFLGANYTSRGSLFDANGDRIATEPNQTSRNDTDTLDINGRLNFNLTDTQSLSFGTQYYKDKQDTRYLPDYGPNYTIAKGPQSERAIKGLELSNQPFTDRYAFNTQYQNQDVWGQTVNLEAYYRNEKGRFFPVYAGGATVNQSQYTVDVAGMRSTVQSDFKLAARDLNLTYGLDYDREKDTQHYDVLSVSNNGMVYKDTGRRLDAGPDTVIQNIGAFLQADYQLTDRFNLQAGTRYQYIKADTDAYTPSRQTQSVASDSTNADKFLFNLGAVYKLTDNQQLFANFSQGFSYPDVLRMLRDVSILTVSTANIEPLTVNSYELGWRLQDDQKLDLGITGFYNTSDKVIQFNADRSVNIADTDQRVYGAEMTAAYPILDDFKIGGTLAYTRGQYKDAAGNWRELNAYQVSPTKGTIFGEWNSDDGYGFRVQMLAVKGTDKAFEDDKVAVNSDKVVPNRAAKIKGYAIMDTLVNFPAYKGRVDFGIYNVWNKDYRTVYSQQSEITFSPVSSMRAQGRTFGLSYTFNY